MYAIDATLALVFLSRFGCISEQTWPGTFGLSPPVQTDPKWKGSPMAMTAEGSDQDRQALSIHDHDLMASGKCKMGRPTPHPRRPSPSSLSPANGKRQSWDRKDFPDRGQLPQLRLATSPCELHSAGTNGLSSSLRSSGMTGRSDRTYYVRPRMD